MSTDAEFDQTHWIPVTRRAPLPTHYYQAHFEEMLGFVEEHYAHVLSPEQRESLHDFRRLPLDARRLYVRLVNRKGRVFAATQLRYPELGNPEPLLAALRAGAWVRSPAVGDLAEILRVLTKTELNRLLLPLVPGMGRALKKADLVTLATTHCRPEVLLEEVEGRLFIQGKAEDMRFLLFLFFGRVQDGLRQFTMRDLGLVRTHDYKDHFEARYADRSEALENWYFARRVHELESAGPGASSTIAALVAEAPEWPEPLHAASAAARDTLAWRLGRRLEEAGDPGAALGLYRRGGSARCSERVARLLLASGCREEAQAYLERAIDDPASDEEALIAEDLYALRFGAKRRSQLTDELRAAPVIDLDESQSGAPEQAAAAWFGRQGQAAFRTENGLWRTFFGLLFWEELFAGPAATLHSPFEFLPSALGDGRFLSDNAEAVEAKFGLLARPSELKRVLLQSSARHYGKVNGVFRWRRSMLDALFALIDRADPAAVRAVLERLCSDYANARHGYPDLMLVDDEGLRFVEIKSDGDQLRRNQLLRLRQLREAGFRADVVRVRWVLDPAQVYVVIDVETTGGHGEQHRVTEIGAVKVRGGEVVDRFHTLINPQRSIPAGITRLTGITPAMVADAPVFADIADELAAFLEGAIFVAHNVDFDYGFIGREFRRLGRPFRYPKLCTCAAMRKLYPGHRSYSLDALCAAYDIELRQHHRALADAQAAAGLLLLVNERRLQAPPPKPACNDETESIALATHAS